MNNLPLDIYDDMPTGMKRYISNYGWHFNKKAYDYATRLMKKLNPKTNREEYICPYSKEEVDNILENNNIKLSNKTMYDYVFVAAMGFADYYGSSIEDEKHLALYIKDTIEDIDGSKDLPFRRWIATMIGTGQPIDWDEIL